jgi:methylenetetrahydrofolate--tRNA-(uracil-5-)-methyltransferase
MNESVRVIGAGLAGSEAAYQLAKRGINVDLWEMRPAKSTPAHHSEDFAELVCSNSLRSNQLENAVGLLKEEMRMLDSIIMRQADNHSVPAGGALAVDREGFSKGITEELRENRNIRIINEEASEICSDQFTIIATGPLTSDRLSESIKHLTKNEYLFFFDAAAPIVTLDSINMEHVFRASRYDKGEDAYLNCPMSREEYERFWNELLNAETAEVKGFEKEILFEGCMPVESMAKRGRDTLLYGPLKPVGLVDPHTGVRPYAVVQLRQDNASGSLFNIVGFQTHLKWGEQKRVFGMIPGLENAEFVRYGVMHRNTYISSPELLLPTLQMREHEKIMFAGQISGVEGYVESASMGLLAGINMANLIQNKSAFIFPSETAIGALAAYISRESTGNFQPMNVNFGLMPGIDERIRDKRQRNRRIAEQSLKKLGDFMNTHAIDIV